MFIGFNCKKKITNKIKQKLIVICEKITIILVAITLIQNGKF